MTTTIVTAEGEMESTAQCPDGFHVTGGGFEIPSWKTETHADLFVEANHPTSDGTGWHARIGGAGASGTIRACAICSENT